MIVLSNSAVQVVPIGGAVTFNLVPLHTGCRPDGCGGAEYHRQGSSSVQLRRPGIYEISFGANVTSTTVGDEIQFSIAVDGSPIAESVMVQTIAAANSYENISKTIPVRICCGDNATVTVVNTSTTETATVDANPSLYIRRIA